MEYPGFVAGAYEALSYAVSGDRLINWYPEIVESKLGKSVINYYPTPGLILHADTSALGAGREMFALDGRMFAVIGATFVEFKADGTFTPYPGLADDGNPAYIVANAAKGVDTPDPSIPMHQPKGTELMIASGGNGYIFDEGALTLTQITGGLEPDGTTPGAFFGCAMPAFLDGYLIALTPDSRDIQISQINDGIDWSALDVSTNAGSADKVIAIISDHEYLYQLGSKRTAIYANSGNADFPLTPVPGAFIEQGIIAPASLRRIDNTLMWLGANEYGGAVAYRANGFIPTRVSTHAVEQAWRKYTTRADAVASIDQWDGHTFYRITFPTADQTWVLDLTTNLWHQRASFDTATGTLHAQTQRFHCYAGGVHYVTGTDGKIYREDPTVFTEDGRPIKRLRQGPVVAKENKMAFVTRLEIVIESGIGLDGDPTAQGANPQMMLRYSGDSGKTWSNEIWAEGGRIGDTEARVIFDQLGSGRAWVPELSTTDPNNWVVVTANVEVQFGAW
ncbi:MAG TPA: hypothetical protein VGJ10_06080 [Paraburkholderia sp.]|jgi:hypothetical protein